jgi:hypothetical protein
MIIEVPDEPEMKFILDNCVVCDEWETLDKKTRKCYKCRYKRMHNE